MSDVAGVAVVTWVATVLLAQAGRGGEGRAAARSGDSHETQLRLATHQDLSETLDASHLHLDLIWGHGAVHHGHVPRACGDAEKTEDMWKESDLSHSTDDRHNFTHNGKTKN